MNICQKFCFLTSALFFILISNLMGSENNDFNSEIFYYDNPTEARGLHVSLKGEDWIAENIQWQDLGFHQNIFTDPKVMSGFADGQTRTSESVRIRFEDSIEKRFAQGFPHGLLSIKDPNNLTSLFMHAVAGGGDREGTSEIAYAMPLKQQGKRLGTKVVTALVERWAPEVCRIGNGINIENENIVKCFQCFGGKPLENLDATASPSNIGSWKILDKNGFSPAKYKLDSNKLFDFDLKEMTFVQLEENLLTLYDSSQTETPLSPGKRYILIDMEGKKRTFSKHDRWNRLKFHFEKSVKPEFK